MIDKFKTFSNAEPLRIEDIPTVEMSALIAETSSAVNSGARFVCWFGQKIPDRDRIRVVSVVADDAGHRLGVMFAEIVQGNSYPSLTIGLPAADRAERELFEQFGICPEGHPWLKPVRHPQPAAKLETDRRLGTVPEKNIGRDYPFWRLEGDAVHEVGVGPIHAGVIGPGYFRFSCVGERIENLEIMLGFEHRGAEELLLSASPSRLPVLVESIVGDSAVAYATAHAQAIESLRGIEISPRAQALRAFALENERLAYHVGDLGALAGDVAYLPSLSYLGRLRGEFLNTAMDLGGNRQGRYFVRPGGVRRDIDESTRTRIIRRFRTAKHELRNCLNQMFSTLSVISRFEGSARVRREDAVSFGFVGPIARASGVAIDIRADHPTGEWNRHRISVMTGSEGSVLDRATIRQREIEVSIDFCIDVMESLPQGEATASPVKLSGGSQKGEFCLSLIEGWRGQVALIQIYDEQGKLVRYKCQDPSFQNWNAMQLANRGNAISDFPISNKSCNLAYNGHDL